MLTVPVGAAIARIAFVVLLLIGWLREDLGPRALAIFAGIGAAIWIGLPRLVAGGENLVTPALAILDVALVFAVFKGDVRLS